MITLIALCYCKKMHKVYCKNSKELSPSSDNKILYDKANKPAISNLIEIYVGFSDLSIEEIEKHYSSKGYGDFKQELGELVDHRLTELQSTYHTIRNNEVNLMHILEEGNSNAQSIANKKLQEVKERIGLL